jgi:hypothetical protein
VGIVKKVEQVRELIREQSVDNLTATNDHRISLTQVLVPPQRISVIAQRVKGSQLKDQRLEVWLVGQESSSDGYKIIMRDDGLQFGLASNGFPADKHLVLVGWYGDLMSAFLSV